ncbi:flagellar biosynthetic protein FliR [Rhodovulum sp. DZ06]|uniref:flagellar biosynthetic protein FliR n=1 Tax=Rhodovulum sp. DZ06 TaxID=3425126 RepID=UPI003D32C0FF
MGEISEALLRLARFGDAPIWAAILVFARVGAAAFLIPGFSNRMIPQRVRLVGALALTVLVAPAAWPHVSALPLEGAAITTLGGFLAAESIVGLMIGIGLRLMIMALQLAGSIAAQSTSVAQIFGAGVTPDPMPAIGNMLVLAALALAFSQGLHVKAVVAMVRSYDIAPAGVLPGAPEAAAWGLERASSAFALAFSLSAPFVAAAFAYNVALGAINRAMPQLMVAFVGAPAITAGALLLLAVSGPHILLFWADVMTDALADPLGPAP